MPEQLMIQLRRSPRKLLERDGHPGPGSLRQAQAGRPVPPPNDLHVGEFNISPEETACRPLGGEAGGESPLGIATRPGVGLLPGGEGARVSGVPQAGDLVDLDDVDKVVFCGRHFQWLADENVIDHGHAIGAADAAGVRLASAVLHPLAGHADDVYPLPSDLLLGQELVDCAPV